MPQKKKNWKKVASEEGVPELAAIIGNLLISEEFFCLWLKGPLGAGKSTMVRAILRFLGLSEKIPVTSPTFTFLNDYDISGKSYAHLDFYRLGDGSNMDQSVILESKSYHGIFIEWPEKVPDQTAIAATHILNIAHSTHNPNERMYEFVCL